MSSQLGVRKLTRLPGGQSSKELDLVVNTYRNRLRSKKKRDINVGAYGPQIKYEAGRARVLINSF